LAATLRIIRPSSRELTDLLPARIDELIRAGFQVLYDDLPPDPDWAYSAASAQARARALEDALVEPDSDIVIAARGGYGGSDLLPLLDFARLRAARPKPLVGFSDVSALHSALYARLGWPGLHAPMPATQLWRKDGDDDDDQILAICDALAQGRGASASLAVTPVSPFSSSSPQEVRGRLFGGCFTVLTNLLATPFFPPSLAGHIVFIEDTDEHPARLMRALNQWLQSGALAGVQALVVGYLRGLGEKIPDSAPFVYEQFARRLGNVPVFQTPLFGHTSPNYPLAVGAAATIAAGRLTWRLP
jgi:muramoyltetrapeptide carboxypeptidase